MVLELLDKLPQMFEKTSNVEVRDVLDIFP